MAHYVISGIPGDEGAVPASPLQDKDSLVGLKLGQVIELGEAVRGEAVADVALDENLLEAGIAELEFEDGVRLWLRGSELETSPFFEVRQERGEVLRLRPTGDTARGVGRVALRLLRLFRPSRPVADLAREKLVERIEALAGRPHGLYALRGAGDPEFEPFQPARGSAERPWLLLIHGTNSTTAGSFGRLWQEAARPIQAQLRNHYGADRLLAFEHRTLSASPLDNALDLVEALPAGARLHVLTHSRGGLIGELIARDDGQDGYFTARDVEFFATAAGADRLAEVDQLRALDARLRDKGIRVERLVRVACPARGTTLASGKLERWLSIVLNLLGRAGGGLAAALAPAAAAPVRMAGELLKTVLLDLADVHELPGLEAMDPASPLIRGLINTPESRSSARLTVIAGDTEGAGFAGRLKMLAVDAFFSNENDLVVDTPSMSGGAQRPDGQSLRYLQRGADIDHFGYFAHAATLRRIASGLTAEHPAAGEFERFTVDQSALREPPVPARPFTRSRSSAPPLVFVLPGIMGSHLQVRGNRIWLDYLDLVRGRFSKLHIDQEDVVAEALEGSTYSSLVEFLARTHEVIPFPYDWRLPIEESGQRLNAALLETLARIDRRRQPIRIVAHSMGGLVARAMMLQADSAWPAICEHPGARLLMMGTPNRGSHAISLLLTGEERLLGLLALLDLRNRKIDLVRIAAAFGGALDMLPAAGTRDYFSVEVWDELLAIVDPQWPRPDAVALDRVRAWRERLDAQVLDPQRVFYLAGQSDETPIDIEIEVGRRGRRLRFMATEEGDGRVPWEGGIPAGIPRWFVPAVHGDIPKHQRSHPAVLDILQQGTTHRLESQPPRPRQPDRRFELRIAPPAFLPDADDLMRAAVGGSREPEVSATTPRPRLPVKVIWGDIRWSSLPVVAGHYAGDTIVSAEAALDRFLDGALAERHELGLYPGPIGSTMVVRRPGRKPGGAVIVGLGGIGDLAPGELARTIRSGVLKWAAEELEALRRAGADEDTDAPLAEEPRGLAFVVVGGNAAGLPLRDSGRSILNGIAQALDQLGDDRVETLRLHGPPLGRIEFIELFQDRAHTFWHGLYELLAREGGDDPLRDRFVLDAGGVRTGRDGRRRLIIEEARDWWQPIRITEPKDGDGLLFENLTDRATAPQRLVATERDQIERLIRSAVTRSARDPELEVALFELLIPNDLKDAAPRLDPLRLLVDARSARIPWELLVDRKSIGEHGHCDLPPDTEPQSVRTGLIRQLVTADLNPRRRMTEGRCALVIGDPESNLPQLDGALEEARTVGNLLEDAGFTARPLLRPTADQVLKALFRCGYRIAHLAGHGVADVDAWRRTAADHTDPSPSDTDPVSGLVIGPYDALTYKHIAQMRDVPELVFINCCHLGYIDVRSASNPQRDQLHAMAAHFGEQFIRQGVRAVVAAGWAVDDQAALLFADEFYQRMLAGETFGEAIRQARALTFNRFPYSNTFAAYQCYGDPSYRLIADDRSTRSAAGARRGPGPFASAEHLIAEGIEPAGSESELEKLVNDPANRAFLDSSAVRAALGVRYRRYGNFDKAIEHFEQALKLHPAIAPIITIEQLQNLQVRQAAKRLDDAEAACERIDDYCRHLENLLGLGETGERRALLASARKRQALLCADQARIEALHQSAEHYARAGNLTATGQHPWALLQAATLYAILAWLGDDRAADRSDDNLTQAKGLLKKAKEHQRPASSEDDFWDRALAPDLALVDALIRQQLSEPRARRIAADYRMAARIARDAGTLGSVIENLDFLLAMLADSEQASAFAERLKEIRAALQ